MWGWMRTTMAVGPVLPQAEVSQIVLVAQFPNEGRPKSEINEFLPGNCVLRGAKEITAPVPLPIAFDSPVPTDVI
jgi:hypothetical protein